MPLDTSDELRAACETSLHRHRKEPTNERWHKDVVDFVEWARAASPAQRRSQEFQKRLWDDNPVAAAGQGQIAIADALANSDFRELVASLFDPVPPESKEQRTQRIRSLFDRVVNSLEPFVPKTPWLKVLRVFAVAFPTDFTSIAHRRRLGQLHRALGGPRGRLHPVDRSRAVLDLLDHALGAPKTQSLSDVIVRLILPWWLYVDHVQDTDEDSPEAVEAARGEVSLKPLPAARRRRGMLAIGGYVETISAILEFVKDGCDRADLIEHIRSINPNLSLKSVPTNIYALISEWGVLKADGTRIELTDRGEAFLESGDPAELADWLLTRILGFDHLLLYIKAHQPVRTLDAVNELKSVNPGWTSNYAPGAMVNWQVKLGLLERLPEGRLELTEAGRQWAALIDWQPDKLNQAAEQGEAEAPEPVGEAEPVLQLPSMTAIQARVASAGVFKNETVAGLHLGLWSRRTRHFAVLSGLSGAGKTLLARAYGAALSGATPEEAANLTTVAVHPGWYEPSALLGYANPLNEDSYVTTSFLRFLLRAVMDPEKPYVAVLDEMNLSHPEQYLAPLLSAMETGGAIHLHGRTSEIDGVPGSVLYPQNLAIIGTVNMDETTQGLSDKILDRAFVLEFWEVDVGLCPAWHRVTLSGEDGKYLRTLLEGMMRALRPVRLHFGWRTIEDVLLFCELNATHKELSVTDAADFVVYAKVIPKLRGDDRPSLRKAFTDLRGVLSEHGLSRSSEKVEELLLDLEHTGTARYWR